MGRIGPRVKTPHKLTGREQQVLELVRVGLTNEEIAERLGISANGVKYHVSEILSKLGVESREEAARWEPEGERRAWWRAIAPLTLAKAAGVAAAVAVLAGLGVLAWGVIDDGGGSETGPGHVAASTGEQAPTSASPSVTAAPPVTVGDPSGTIVFTRDRRIYSMGADGSDVTALTPVTDAELAGAFGPSWSPTGEWVTYISGRGGFGFYGWVNLMRPDGSEITQLGRYEYSDVIPQCTGGSTFAWSADGSMLAYASNPGGVRVVEVPSGEHVDLEISPPGRGFGPTWSPDGTEVAFSSWRWPAPAPSGSFGDNEFCRVTVLSLETGETREVADGVAPSWSPEGSRIVFSRGGSLHVVNADGSGEQTIMTDGDVPGEPLPAGYPAQVVLGKWSPDGRRIAAVINEQLAVADVETGEIEILGPGSSPAWSPDGHWIAFTRVAPNPLHTPPPTGGQLLRDVVHVMRPDGVGEAIPLAIGDSPAWQPAPE